MEGVVAGEIEGVCHFLIIVGMLFSGPWAVIGLRVDDTPRTGSSHLMTIMNNLN